MAYIPDNNTVERSMRPIKLSKKLAVRGFAAGHTLLPLPRYSPDLNPIEQAFAILKRQRQFSGREVGDLISSHS